MRIEGNRKTGNGGVIVARTARPACAPPCRHRAVHPPPIPSHIRLHVGRHTRSTGGTFRMARLNVNGKVLEHDAEPDTPLLWVLREQLGLTGTKYGCGVAQCGSCTVHLDGAAVRSCVLPVSAVQPTQKIVTIEGLSARGDHPLQKAWVQLDVPQCGYCQSGMIMAAAALLKAKPKPTDADIDEQMTNICRCGTYNRVRAAIKQAAGVGGSANRAAVDIVHVVRRA
jgi:isoquinoline 1-oxidoreductase alpha subunit